MHTSEATSALACEGSSSKRSALATSRQMPTFERSTRSISSASLPGGQVDVVFDGHLQAKLGSSA
jgi:hypothetical protein